MAVGTSANEDPLKVRYYKVMTYQGIHAKPSTLLAKITFKHPVISDGTLFKLNAQGQVIDKSSLKYIMGIMSLEAGPGTFIRIEVQFAPDANPDEVKAFWSDLETTIQDPRTPEDSSIIPTLDRISRSEARRILKNELLPVMMTGAMAFGEAKVSTALGRSEVRGETGWTMLRQGGMSKDFTEWNDVLAKELRIRLARFQKATLAVVQEDNLKGIQFLNHSKDWAPLLKQTVSILKDMPGKRRGYRVENALVERTVPGFLGLFKSQEHRDVILVTVLNARSETRQIKTILFADNDSSMRIVIPDALKFAGYQVEVAAGIDEAMALLQKQNFDLVITDIHMNDKDPHEETGVRLARAVHQGNPKTPVILLTAANPQAFMPLRQEGVITMAISKDEPADVLLTHIENIERTLPPVATTGLLEPLASKEGVAPEIKRPLDMPGGASQQVKRFFIMANQAKGSTKKLSKAAILLPRLVSQLMDKFPEAKIDVAADYNLFSSEGFSGKVSMVLDPEQKNGIVESPEGMRTIVTPAGILGDALEGQYAGLAAWTIFNQYDYVLDLTGCGAASIEEAFLGLAEGREAGKELSRLPIVFAGMNPLPIDNALPPKRSEPVFMIDPNRPEGSQLYRVAETENLDRITSKGKQPLYEEQALRILRELGLFEEKMDLQKVWMPYARLTVAEKQWARQQLAVAFTQSNLASSQGVQEMTQELADQELLGNRKIVFVNTYSDGEFMTVEEWVNFLLELQKKTGAFLLFSSGGVYQNGSFQRLEEILKQLREKQIPVMRMPGIFSTGKVQTILGAVDLVITPLNGFSYLATGVNTPQVALTADGERDSLWRPFLENSMVEEKGSLLNGTVTDFAKGTLARESSPRRRVVLGLESQEVKLSKEEIKKQLLAMAVRKYKRVLVVDDDSSLRSLMKMLLRTVGLGSEAVDVAKDGVEGLQMLKTGNYDFVLTDVNMPGMEGDDMLLAAARAGIRKFHAIVASGYDAERVKKRKAEFAEQNILHRVLQKPYGSSELTNTIVDIVYEDRFASENRSEMRAIDPEAVLVLLKEIEQKWIAGEIRYQGNRSAKLGKVKPDIIAKDILSREIRNYLFIKQKSDLLEKFLTEQKISKDSETLRPVLLSLGAQLQSDIQDSDFQGALTGIENIEPGSVKRNGDKLLGRTVMLGIPVLLELDISGLIVQTATSYRSITIKETVEGEVPFEHSLALGGVQRVQMENVLEDLLKPRKVAEPEVPAAYLTGKAAAEKIDDAFTAAVMRGALTDEVHLLPLMQKVFKWQKRVEAVQGATEDQFNATDVDRIVKALGNLTNADLSELNAAALEALEQRSIAEILPALADILEGKKSTNIVQRSELRQSELIRRLISDQKKLFHPPVEGERNIGVNELNARITDLDSNKSWISREAFKVYLSLTRVLMRMRDDGAATPAYVRENDIREASVLVGRLVSQYGIKGEFLKSLERVQRDLNRWGDAKRDQQEALEALANEPYLQFSGGDVQNYLREAGGRWLITLAEIAGQYKEIKPRFYHEVVKPKVWPATNRWLEEPLSSERLAEARTDSLNILAKWHQFERLPKNEKFPDGELKERHFRADVIGEDGLGSELRKKLFVLWEGLNAMILAAESTMPPSAVVVAPPVAEVKVPVTPAEPQMIQGELFRSELRLVEGTKAFKQSESRTIKLIPTDSVEPEVLDTIGKAARALGDVYLSKAISDATGWTPEQAHAWIAVQLLKEEPLGQGKIDNAKLREILDIVSRSIPVGTTNLSSPSEERGLHVALPLLDNNQLEDLTAFAPFLLALASSLNTKLYLNARVAPARAQLIERSFLEAAERSGVSVRDGQFRVFSAFEAQQGSFKSLEEKGVLSDALLAAEKEQLRDQSAAATHWYNSPNAQKNIKTLASEIAEALYAALDQKVPKGKATDISVYSTQLATAILNAIQASAKILQSA